jgi:hypothetical protein
MLTSVIPGVRQPRAGAFSKHAVCENAGNARLTTASLERRVVHDYRTGKENAIVVKKAAKGSAVLFDVSALTRRSPLAELC